jgi:hypothetical protein
MEIGTQRVCDHVSRSHQSHQELEIGAPHTKNLTSPNENINGLLRQYFPKGTHIHHYSEEDLARVTNKLNIRPRKTLGWKSPAECFDTLSNGSKLTSVAMIPRTQAINR